LVKFDILKLFLANKTKIRATLATAVLHALEGLDLKITTGKACSSVVAVLAGAIYATEVVEMITEGRFRPLPYDPKFPVHRIWDLGWNDQMVCIMVQKPHPSVLNIINYLEESHITYANMLTAMDPLHYRWGIDWLPHDGDSHHPTSGTSARKVLVGADVPGDLVSAGDLVIDVPGLETVDDDDATLLDVLVGQTLAFFRCMATGLRPDSPSDDGVISRVVESFEIHRRT